MQHKCAFRKKKIVFPSRPRAIDCFPVFVIQFYWIVFRFTFLLIDKQKCRQDFKIDSHINSIFMLKQYELFIEAK